LNPQRARSGRDYSAWRAVRRSAQWPEFYGMAMYTKPAGMAHYGLSSDVACRVAVKNPPHRNWKSSPPQLEIRRGLKCERLGIPIRLESDLSPSR